MKFLDNKSLFIGAIAAVILLACTDARTPSPVVSEAMAASQDGQKSEIGRFVFHSSSPTHILDSTTGTVYYGAQFDEGPWKKHHWMDEE